MPVNFKKSLLQSTLYSAHPVSRTEHLSTELSVSDFHAVMGFHSEESTACITKPDVQNYTKELPLVPLSSLPICSTGFSWGNMTARDALTRPRPARAGDTAAAPRPAGRTRLRTRATDLSPCLPAPLRPLEQELTFRILPPGCEQEILDFLNFPRLENGKNKAQKLTFSSDTRRPYLAAPTDPRKGCQKGCYSPWRRDARMVRTWTCGEHDLDINSAPPATPTFPPSPKNRLRHAPSPSAPSMQTRGPQTAPDCGWPWIIPSSRVQPEKNSHPREAKPT